MSNQFWRNMQQFMSFMAASLFFLVMVTSLVWVGTLPWWQDLGLMLLVTVVDMGLASTWFGVSRKFNPMAAGATFVLAASINAAIGALIWVVSWPELIALTAAAVLVLAKLLLQYVYFQGK